MRRLCVALLISCLPAPALAWKPYTHNTSAYEAYDDAVDDGYVTIAGSQYKVADALVAALRAQPAAYNAGVLGPDGFPDLVYGQSVIHSQETGAWLRHLLAQAWAFQDLPDVIGPLDLTTEKQKSLAFTYGFLTHAAGDLWGHTFVNDFARGVFPAVTELGDVEKLSIVLRHLAVEGYVGDATPGFDGDRTDWTQLPDGDWSDDSTPAILYDAPHAFIYAALIDADAGTPPGGRGFLIDHFRELREGLQTRVAALESAGLGGAGVTTYLREWIHSIDVGLANWSVLSQELARALFDPGYRRHIQNLACGWLGVLDPTAIPNCERSIGTRFIVRETLRPFASPDFPVEPSLLAMLGVQRSLVAGLAPLEELAEEIAATAGLPFDPVRVAVIVAEQEAKVYVEREIEKLLGIPLEDLESILTSPERWVCIDQPTPLPGGGEIPGLFRPGDHARLDQLLGLTAGHHLPGPSGPACGRLAGHAELEFAHVAALHNTITTAKLLLLDGPELNRVLGDLLDRPVVGYRPGDNVMVRALDPARTWLRSIDGDHAWRQDGLPRFPGRPAEENGGHGNFPLWESCVLRPAFRQLFVDWEGAGFPDLGDATSADDANDSSPPEVRFSYPQIHYVDGDVVWVTAGNSFAIRAVDDLSGPGFNRDQLTLRMRIAPTRSPFPAPNLQTVGQDSTFTVQGPPDGSYDVDVETADPCHDWGQPRQPRSTRLQVGLDSQPPRITCKNPPFTREWDTDDTVRLDFEVADFDPLAEYPLGSGVGRVLATLDGYQGDGAVEVLKGQTLDLFSFAPGTRSVSIFAADNLRQESTATCTFELRANPQSLATNVTRAYTVGLIDGQATADTMRQKLEEAQRLHDRGQHKTEGNALQAFVNHVRAQRGKKVDAAAADRFIAFALDRIASGR